MKTTFNDIAIEVLEREGGFVDHPADRGGATKFGVTIETLRRHGIDVDGDGDIDTDDVEALPLETALKLYKQRYWDPSRAEELPTELRELYFDMCIHHGQRNAVYMLQKAARAEGRMIKTDGLIGPMTIAAAAHVRLVVLLRERARFFCRIAKRDHSQIDFIEGWINRIFDFLID